MQTSRFEIPVLRDDGLVTPEVGDWSEDKYRLVNLYTRLFTKSMRRKWHSLVYLDLFAGAGRSRIRGTQRVFPASPTLALSVQPPFDLHIFCEQDQDLLNALRERAERDFPSREAKFVWGDVNDTVTTILGQLPAASARHRVLGFCFVDPFSLKNLAFSTIEELSERYMDFLVLIPTGYDATRNEALLVEDNIATVDRFLGNSDWREAWQTAKRRGTTFDVFITDAFGESMKRLRYLYEGIPDTQIIRMTTKNVPLYRLALFSRDPLGAKFWREVKKYAPDQRRLF